MKRDPGEEEDELALFRQAVDGAAPHDHDRIEPWRRRLAPRPLDHPEVDDDETTAAERLSASQIETHDELSFCRPGVQQRLFHALRRGHLEIGLELDLHGYTTEQAREIFKEFLRDCHRRRIRCARIIHGKGYGSEGQQPILKQRVNLWLQQREDVLAFCSATRRDGGTGAVYVLLRSAQKGQRR